MYRSLRATSVNVARMTRNRPNSHGSRVAYLGAGAAKADLPRTWVCLKSFFQNYLGPRWRAGHVWAKESRDPVCNRSIAVPPSEGRGRRATQKENLLGLRGV